MDKRDLRDSLFAVRPGDQLRLLLRPGSNMHLPAVHVVDSLRERGILSISDREMNRIYSLAQNWALGSIKAAAGEHFQKNLEIFLEEIHCFGWIEKV